MTRPAWPVVLFDFDGTLADTIPLIVASYHHALASAGLAAVSDTAVRSWIGRPLQPVLEDRYPGRGAELTGIYRQWNLANHDELIVVVDGIRELLSDLVEAGARIGCVSSKRADTVRLGLRAVGIDDLVDVLAGMDETTEHKPSPAPLLHAAGLLGVDPGECVYVGDADVDVLAARAAGMGSVAVTWGAATGEHLTAFAPDVLVDDVPALRAVLLPDPCP